MALVFLGKTPCQLCGCVLNDGEEIRAFPAFLGPEHHLARFSDAAVHAACFAGCDEHDEVEALLAGSASPSGGELATLELELAAELEEHRDPTRTEQRWREVHSTYAEQAEVDEALKRALFIQWYAHAEARYVTGIGELDQVAEERVVSLVAERLRRADPDLLEAELRHMVAWYRHWFEPPLSAIPDPAAPPTPEDPPCRMIESTTGRGSMGQYWARLCGEWNRDLIKNSRAANANAFRVAQRVLRGEIPPPRGGSTVHKGLALVLPLRRVSRVDATPEEVVARHERDNRRTSMFVESLPAAVGDLMQRAGLTAVTESVVCRLPAGRFFSGPQPDRTMWIVPGTDRITMYFADASEISPPDHPMSPIDEARYPVPELRAATPWTPDPPTFVDRSGYCPHCAAAGTRWRQLSDKSFVCPACSRPFASEKLRSDSVQSDDAASSRRIDELVAKSASALELPELKVFAIVLAEEEDGGGKRLELQRSLSSDEQDQKLEQDTYCLSTHQGAVHYGGVESWELRPGSLELRLDAAAAEALGTARRLVVRFDPNQRTALGEALPRVLAEASDS